MAKVSMAKTYVFDVDGDKVVAELVDRDTSEVSADFKAYNIYEYPEDYDFKACSLLKDGEGDKRALLLCIDDNNNAYLVRIVTRGKPIIFRLDWDAVVSYNTVVEKYRLWAR